VNPSGKHEIRISKLETNSNDEKLKIPNKLDSASGFAFSPHMGLFACPFVSIRGAAFDIRISDFASF
jgi:hypothetical protein